MEFRSAILTAGVLAALGSPQASLAQQSENRDVDSLEEVVVTARRREEALQDVPISVSAIGAQALEREGVQNILDIGAKVPSLTITATGAIRSIVAFAIRGQRSQESQLLTDPPVGTYFAEVVQPRPFGFGNTLFDIQSVQVLKGVQGTLFGRNMTGGAVLVEPNLPTDEFQAEVRATAGNYALRDVYGMVNIPVGDVVAIRLAGKTRERDGWMTDVSNGRDYDDQNFDAFRASVLLTPFDGLKSNTIFDYYEADEHGTGAVISALRPGSTASFIPGMSAALAAQQARSAADPFRFDPGSGDGGRLDAFGVAPFEENENYGVTNKTTYELTDNLTLKNIFGYRSLERKSVLDYEGTPVVVITADQFADIETYSEELQLQGLALGGRLNYTVGAYYFVEDGEDASRSSQLPALALGAFPPGTPASTIIAQNGAVGRSTTYAAYAAGGYDLTEQLTLSGGVRYNYDERRATVGPRRPNLAGGTCTFDLDILTPGTQTVPIQACRFTDSENWDEVTWDATLRWEPTDSAMLYGAVRHGFRAGGFSTRASDFLTFTPFDPETVLEYEIGAKNSFDLGGPVATTSVAVFYQDYEDVQKQRAFQAQSATGPVTVTIIGNTAKQEHVGGEFEGTLDFGNGLSTSIFYSYVDVTIKEGQLVGEYEMRGIAQHQIGGTINFAADLKSAGELNLNANASYRSDTPLDEFDIEGEEPSYTLVNLRASLDGIAGTGLGIAAFVNNVTDEEYRVGVLGLMREVGFLSDVYGEPRMYGFELAYKF